MIGRKPLRAKRGIGIRKIATITAIMKTKTYKFEIVSVLVIPDDSNVF